MKTQMRFQKILTLCTLIVAALTFVFALIFCTGNLSDITHYMWNELSIPSAYNKEGLATEICDSFIIAEQNFVSICVGLSIAYILVTAVLYITASNTRRNYYITNYIAVGLAIAFSVVMALFLIIEMSVLIASFNGIDKAAFDAYYNYSYIDRTGETVMMKTPTDYVDFSNYTMFILGYIVSIIVLAVGALHACNLLWKIKLMQGEKALLGTKFEKEVA